MAQTKTLRRTRPTPLPSEPDILPGYITPEQLSRRFGIAVRTLRRMHQARVSI
jgi:hypothetical protein